MNGVVTDNPGVDGSQDRLVIVKDDLQSFIGSYGAMFLCVTRRPPTIASVDFYRDALREHHANYPGVLELVVVLDSRRPRMTQGVRAKIVDLWSEFGSKVTVAVVTGGDTFAGALRRKFIEAIVQLRVRRTPFRIVSTSAEAVGWFNARDEDTGKRCDRTGWIAIIEHAIRPANADPGPRRASLL